jgi:PKHD-type hydroxylase
MNLKNYYYYFKNALTPKFCDDVIRYGLLQKEQVGLTVGAIQNKDKRKEKEFKKLRNSNVVWLDDNWIYKEIHPYINEANKRAEWNFEWDSSQRCQFTKYKINQFYDWHCDSEMIPYDDGKIRKLSVTCQLTDGSEYKGGELEFDFRNNSGKRKDVRTCEEILGKGSIVVFPSFVWHRVKPVTEGTRYSLVVWNLGYPFK